MWRQNDNRYGVKAKKYHPYCALLKVVKIYGLDILVVVVRLKLEKLIAFPRAKCGIRNAK